VVVGSLKPSKLVWDVDSQGPRKDEVFVVLDYLMKKKLYSTKLRRIV
jgi:hypothetical protein